MIRYFSGLFVSAILFSLVACQPAANGAGITIAEMLSKDGVERLASSPLSEKQPHWVAAVDENQNRLLLWHGRENNYQHKLEHDPGAVLLEGACFAEHESDLYLFLYDDRGYLEQFWLDQSSGVIRSVRRLPGMVAITDCAALDEWLYINEEKVGVWRVAVDPESEGLREVVMLEKPHGALPKGVEYFDTRIDEGLSIAGLSIARSVSVPRFPLAKVQAQVETEPVYTAGDAADDPAIWFNAASPKNSLILAADKQFGLRLYDLKGREVQSIEAGRLNNVDVRPWPGSELYTHIAAASNRTTKSISLFGVKSSGEVDWLRNKDIKLDLADPYGICLYLDSDEVQAFVNDKDGRYQQWLIVGDNSPKELRAFSVYGQPEGCVVDDEQELLFFGIEDQGVRVINANPDTPLKQVTIDDVGEGLVADVEGMALYSAQDRKYLLVSSQGDNSYRLYDSTPPFALLLGFEIVADHSRGIDGASETDGLAVSSKNFGSEFPYGILVVQDGHNVMPSEAQNFKLVDWRQIQSKLSPLSD